MLLEHVAARRFYLWARIPHEATVDRPSRGARLDADHPENGVLIPCRFTAGGAQAWTAANAVTMIKVRITRLGPFSFRSFGSAQLKARMLTAKHRHGDLFEP